MFFTNRDHLRHRRFQMRKHMSFAIAAVAMGLAIFFLINPSVVETNADSPKLANPHLPAGVFAPLY
jgi:hypothetical protein